MIGVNKTIYIWRMRELFFFKKKREVHEERMKVIDGLSEAIGILLF